MDTRTAILLFAGACIAACGGKTIDGDPSGSTSQQAKGGSAGGQPAPARTTSSGDVPILPPAPECTESGSSASGGPGANGDFTCSSESAFQCTTGEVSIKCECRRDSQGNWLPGICSCTNKQDPFPFDCSKGCQPGATEYANCKLPAPDDDPGGYSSSSSSGASSSGG